MPWARNSRIIITTLSGWSATSARRGPINWLHETNPSNETDERNFSHSGIRRMRAEVLLDCVSQVTETKDKFRGLPLGAHAVQIADGNTY